MSLASRAPLEGATPVPPKVSETFGDLTMVAEFGIYAVMAAYTTGEEFIKAENLSTVQDNALTCLRPIDKLHLVGLRHQLARDGFDTNKKLIVLKTSSSGKYKGKYIVIEGNHRVVIVQSGVDGRPLLTKTRELPCIVLEGVPPEVIRKYSHLLNSSNESGQAVRPPGDPPWTPPPDNIFYTH